MMFYALLSLAAVAATPVIRAAPAAPAAPVPAPPVQPPAARVKPTNYCVIRTPTGSHLRLKTCHTREEWIDRGFDPLARQN
ncbi:hypothetical protein [Sphingomonas sp.]|uniref:hypothetical protein n=1 Tax=Sphingomonas sp. TaxID=28214 RepID=UPI003B003A8F